MSRWDLSIVDILLYGALCIFILLLTIAVILSFAGFYNNYVYNLHQPRINTTVVVGYSSDSSAFGFVDMNTGKGYFDYGEVLKYGHKYNITYYCNYANERMVESATDLEVVVDPYKCVNVNGTCT